MDHVAEQQLVLPIELTSSNFYDPLNSLYQSRESRGAFEDMEMGLFSSTEIRQFLEDMSNHTGNPFVGRTLILNSEIFEEVEEDEEEDEDANPFWNSAKQLLQRFGKHIQNICLVLEAKEFRTRSKIAEHLASVLTLTPALKTLKIEVWVEQNYNHVYYGDTGEINWDAIEPLFEHLKFINLWGMSSPLTELLLEVVHKMCHRPEKVSRIVLMNIIPPNLKLLYPNLEIFERIFHGGPALHGLEFQETFSYFGQFAETLTTLDLRHSLIVKRSLLENVNLPNLKKLTLFNIECNTLNFLKQFDSLAEMETRKIVLERPRPQKNLVKDYFYGDTFFEIEKQQNSYDILPKEVKILLYLSKYLKKKDFLRLRLVSQTWRQAVDRVAKHEQLYALNRHFPFQEYKFGRVVEFQDFLSTMDRHSGNPFVGRSVNICECNSPRVSSSPEFRQLGLNLQNRFGGELYKLTWSNDGTKEHRTEIMEVQRLMNVLKLTRNISVLNIHIEPEPRKDYLSIQAPNFPTLRHLKSLSVTGSEHLLYIVHKMCCHPERVTKLAVAMVYTSKLAAMFPNVENFSGNFSKKEDFASLKNSGWRLQTLIGAQVGQRQPRRLKLKEVAPDIQHFRETLTSLTLHNVMFIDSDDHFGLPHLNKLNLSCVKTRSLEIFFELPELYKMKLGFLEYKRQGKFKS